MMERKYLKMVLCVVIALGMLSTVAMAASVTLTWQAPTTNTDGTLLTDLEGYMVYRGLVPDTYVESRDAGNILTYTWDVGNQEGNTLYFVVTAYDISGNESDDSNEVSATFPILAPSPPTNLTVVVD